jgi:hypothetical protein
MVRTCFALDAIAAYKDVPLRQWAHMLGYHGHAATKSRRYSVTYGELREGRKAHQDAERREAGGLPPLDDRETVVDAEWASCVQASHAEKRGSWKVSVLGRTAHVAFDRPETGPDSLGLLAAPAASISRRSGTITRLAGVSAAGRPWGMPQGEALTGRCLSEDTSVERLRGFSLRRSGTSCRWDRGSGAVRVHRIRQVLLVV